MKKLPLILILLFIACGHEGISIVKTQGTTARKTTAGLSEKQYDSIKALNPEMNDTSLEKAGLIRGGQLLVEKFNHSDTDFELSNNEEIIKAKCGSRNDAFKITLSKNGHSQEIVMKDPNTQFCIADVIPGGYDEIITLDTYYIMNGDNFDVEVYEVK